MSEFIRITVYRTREGLSCHVEHMLGAMPRPKVLRRREWTAPSAHGTPSWGAALRWASEVLKREASRLSAAPVATGGALPPPPLGGRGGEGSPANPQP